MSEVRGGEQQGRHLQVDQLQTHRKRMSNRYLSCDIRKASGGFSIGVMEDCHLDNYDATLPTSLSKKKKKIPNPFTGDNLKKKNC